MPLFKNSDDCLLTVTHVLGHSRTDPTHSHLQTWEFATLLLHQTQAKNNLRVGGDVRNME